MVKELSASVTGTRLLPVPASNPQVVDSACLSSGVHTIQSSKDWRKSNVPPIFKKGKKEELGNYGPVSLTSLPRKVMEQ